MIAIPNYRVSAKLYESTHSIVCRGHRKADDKPVILKLLNKIHPTPIEIARFKREYKMTCSLNEEGVIKALTVGADDWIQKPIHKQRLLVRVKRLLKSK